MGIKAVEIPKLETPVSILEIRNCAETKSGFCCFVVKGNGD